MAGCGSKPRPPAIDIWKAAGEGNTEAVKQHVDAGTDISATFVAPGVPGSGGSPLHVAVLANQSGTAKALIEGEADLNVKAQNEQGDTPLGWAAAFGRTAIAKLLIDAGADTQIGNNQGSTPLHAGVFLCHADTVELLLDSGADATAKDNSGLTPLDTVTTEWSAELEGIYNALGAIMEIDLAKIKAD